MRWVAIVHSLPERTRLRCPALRGDEPLVERLADALAAMPGVTEVRVRPYTGSVLVTHDERITATTLAEAVQDLAGCERVIAQGETPPPQAVPDLSTIARAASAAMRAIDRDVMKTTGGRLDLGTLATMGFFGAGALEAISQRTLQTPPWFNLAWWGWRTFMTTERAEIQADEGAPVTR